MNFYFISPIGQKSYLLYDTFEETFIEKGHEIVSEIEYADIVFYDIWCGFGEYDKEEILGTVIDSLPVFVFDFHDYNDTTIWPGFNNWDHLQNQEWAYNLKTFIRNGQVKGYFMRKLNQTLDYPDYVIPIECCIYPDHIFELSSFEQFSSREYDICFIGTKSKERENVVAGLIDAGFKVDYQFTEERIPHNEWLDRHRNAKLFLSADGGGYGDERMFQLSAIAAMIKQKNNQLCAFGRHGIPVNEKITNDDKDTINNGLDNAEMLHRFYIDSWHGIFNQFNSKARAAYVLKNVLQRI